MAALAAIYFKEIMRQKRIKAATFENLSSLGVIVDDQLLPLDGFINVNLEIGAGKGTFITSLAGDFENELFIAVERDKSAAFRLAQKKDKLNLNNLIVVCLDAKNISQWLPNHSIKTIHLNFSDPWPKTKHHKRRLTFEPFLKVYQDLLIDQGLLQFRTDHLDFFNDSLTYFEKYFKSVKVDYDLPVSAYMTEYEIKKRVIGKIYQYQGLNIVNQPNH